MTRAIVLQHIRCEPPGVFTDVLRERGVEIVRAELDEGDDLPPLDTSDILVVMGGPMGVDDESAHPWLAPEKRYIKEAVRAGTAYFGVCLGAQLLAASLGAPVRRGPRPEVGILNISLTAEAADDPVFKLLGVATPVLQWHGDTFDLPAGARHLASSEAYENQAFRIHDKAYGLQFHLEVTEAMFEEWKRVPAYVEALSSALGPTGADAFAKDFAAARPLMAEVARKTFESFLSLAGA